MKDISKSHFFCRWLLMLSVISALTVAANGLQCYNCTWGDHTIVERGSWRPAWAWAWPWQRKIGQFGDVACNTTGGKLVDISPDRNNTNSRIRCYKMTTYYKGQFYSVRRTLNSEERFKKEDLKDHLGDDANAIIPNSGCKIIDRTIEDYKMEVCACDEDYCNGPNPEQQPATISDSSGYTEVSEDFPSITSNLSTNNLPKSAVTLSTEDSRNLQLTNISYSNSIQCAECFSVDTVVAANHSAWVARLNNNYYQKFGQINDSRCSGDSSNLPTRRLENPTYKPFCFTAKTFVNGKLCATLRMPLIEPTIRGINAAYEGLYNITWPLKVPAEGGCVKQSVQSGLEIENCICYTDKCIMNQTSHNSQPNRGNQTSHGSHISYDNQTNHGNQTSHGNLNHPSIVYLFVLVLYLSLC